MNGWSAGTSGMIAIAEYNELQAPRRGLSGFRGMTYRQISLYLQYIEDHEQPFYQDTEHSQ